MKTVLEKYKISDKELDNQIEVIKRIEAELEDLRSFISDSYKDTSKHYMYKFTALCGSSRVLQQGNGVWQVDKSPTAIVRRPLLSSEWKKKLESKVQDLDQAKTLRKTRRYTVIIKSLSEKELVMLEIKRAPFLQNLFDNETVNLHTIKLVP